MTDVLMFRGDQEVWFPLKSRRKKFQIRGVMRAPRAVPALVPPAPCAALIALKHWRSMGGARPDLLHVILDPGCPPLVQGRRFEEDGDDEEVFLCFVYRWHYVESVH